MLKNSVLSASALLAAAPAAAFEMSYDTFSIGYEQVEIADIDFSGFSFAGTAALNERIFVLGAYTTVESDDEYGSIFAGFDTVDANVKQLGIGAHSPVSDNVDFVASISYVEEELESTVASADGDGYSLSAGIRARPTRMTELSAAVTRSEIEDEGDTGYAVGGRIFVSPAASIGLAFSSADDVDGTTVSVRFDF